MAVSLYRRPVSPSPYPLSLGGGERRVRGLETQAMLHASWFRGWKSDSERIEASHARRRAGAQRAARRHSFVPRLEFLEDRSLPSTLTVSNALDSGAGSLRGQIAAAKSGDAIVFAASLKNKTITLTSGELVIDKSLDIEGLGAQKLTVSGNDASRVFDI